MLVKALTTIKNIETGFFQPHNRTNCVVCQTGIPCKDCIDEESIKLGRLDIKKDDVLYVRYQHKNTVSLADQNGFIYSVNISDFHTFFENLNDRAGKI